ncbi:trehalose-phosphatase [Paracraurococcus ruber]|uniref:Trehalose 6-phosphate phosphatase n=2 Tax=Paracraurococcus ruber TaxID=77675 RepID=A0ABS1D3N4_9PROT|nr:trehalose-phosphatase [Paracraurococcus ruber]MBK1661060.1 trehalose-phosphatase [Paracraurococcus ruber]TDG30978.1 trehalose-phosphatase [Paracraurococcus ruber]
MPGLGPIGRAALLLDFDGTLVEIAPRPDAVRVPPDLPGLLHRLSGALQGALAIVSGRPLRDLDQFLPVPLAMAGDHGASLRPEPGRPALDPDLPNPPAAWRARAAALVAAHPGALIEDKDHGFVVHYRQAPDLGPAAEALLASLVAEDAGAFTLLEARMAWEVKPRGASKGTATAALMGRPPFQGRVPVFIGDDVTDEEGMAVARRLGGFGFRLQDAFGTPAALRDWLASAVAPPFEPARPLATPPAPDGAGP